ncbi:MAG: hypothetical protein WA419_03805 [Silvibacterium sp.]
MTPSIAGPHLKPTLRPELAVRQLNPTTPQSDQSSVIHTKDQPDADGLGGAKRTRPDGQSCLDDESPEGWSLKLTVLIAARLAECEMRESEA